MHVGVFALRDLRVPGASLVRIVGLTRSLAALHLRTTFVAPNGTVELRGVPFVQLDGPCRRSGLSASYAAFPTACAPLRWLPADRALARVLELQRFDVIHCHQHQAGVRLFKIRRRLATPVVLDVHGLIRIQEKDHRATARAPWRLAVLLRMERNVFRGLDALTVRTEAERDFVAHTYRLSPERIYVVPDGVDVDDVGSGLEARDREALLAELGVLGRRMIFFAGEFKSQSGILDLVRAFAQASRERRDLALVMIGDGVLMPEVKRLVSDERLGGVALLGRRTRAEFRRYQALADVVVTPEIKSTYNELAPPLKLLDCLSSGRPTVATRIASHCRIVVDGVTGYLVEPQDSGDMARGLLRALDDPRAREIGDRARQLMMNHFSWVRSAEYAMQAFAEIIARSRAAGAA